MSAKRSVTREWVSNAVYFAKCHTCKWSSGETPPHHVAARGMDHARRNAHRVLTLRTVEYDFRANQRQLLIAEGVTEKLDDNNAALRTENESLRQDAERLDWLIDSGVVIESPIREDHMHRMCVTREVIDSLASRDDAAMKPTPETK